MLLRLSVIATLVAALGLPVNGQSTADHPVEQSQPYSLSWAQTNLVVEPTVVLDETIQVEGAAWLRVYFGDTQLSEGSFVRITSLTDGEFQELDAATLDMWSYGSAYFNGESVQLELIVAPGPGTNQLAIESIGYHPPADVHREAQGGGGQCGICGPTDDRVPSDDLWTARLFPAGCTSSVFQSDSCMVSAGHCVSGGMVVQFNVPPSLSNCQTINPPVADQFPITAFDFNNNGPGDDWSVMMPGTNGLGQSPYERYGELKVIATTVAPVGTLVRLTGYGVDTTCTLSQTQQTATGSICAVFNNAYEFSVDLRGGNSGSSLLRESSQEIIGIATHCPCCNIATRITNSDFALARANFCPEPETQFTSLPFFDDFPEVELNQELWTGIEDAEGSTRGINEPSPTLSLNLDATNPGGEEVRSAFIDTSGLADLRLTYWYEQTGIDDPPEDGDDLIIEYLNSSENWVELNRHFGSEPDMEDYVFVAIELPEAAKHSTFRLRLRCTSDDSGSDDDWFVDNVCIGSSVECPDPEPVPCPHDLDGDNAVGVTDLLELLGLWGTDPGGPPDFDGDGDVGVLDLLELLGVWGPCP